MDAILKEHQHVLLENLDAEWTDDTTIGRTLAGQKIVSCLVVPLVHEKGQLGILAAYTPDMRQHFSSEEILLLQGVASQGAVAIYNATLHGQLQEAYDKQKELDKYKDEFILMVSHEFRTPVTAIEGYVTLISRHGDKLDQRKLNQFAGEIRQATSQLMGMIGMLQDANRTDEMPLEVTLDPVNIRESAEKVIDSRTPEIKARLQLEMDADYWVLADGERLATVFSNLISNAIKYSPTSTMCRIKARVESRESLRVSGRSKALQENASPQWVAKLFQKFGRLQRSMTTSIRGTGLGLWICKQYIEAMGGDIWVDSEFGKGSTFQFSLPVTQPAKQM
jgi:signal transduction histidine kinase